MESNKSLCINCVQGKSLQTIVEAILNRRDLQEVFTREPRKVRHLKLVAAEINVRAGKIEYIDGVQCYIATPTSDYSKEKVLLYLTDAFGIPLANNKVEPRFLLHC